jgi:hypothetical protein
MSNNEYKKLVIRLIKDNRVSEEEALILINNINNECKSDTHVIQTEKPLVTDNEELNKLLKDYGEYPQSPFVYKKEERKFPSDITITYTEKDKNTYPYPFSDSEYRVSDYPFPEPVTCTSTSNIGYKTEE